MADRHRVLFLDVDGVLNSAAWFERLQRQDSPIVVVEPDHQLDPKAVAHLNRICSATGCTVVLSSSWRLAWTLRATEMWLRLAGYTGPLFAGATPNLGHRGQEITAYLAEHPADVYVCLDDDPDRDWHEGRWVVTKYTHGLTETEAQRVIDLLLEVPRAVV